MYTDVHTGGSGLFWQQSQKQTVTPLLFVQIYKTKASVSRDLWTPALSSALLSAACEGLVVWTCGACGGHQGHLSSSMVFIGFSELLRQRALLWHSHSSGPLDHTMQQSHLLSLTCFVACTWFIRGLHYEWAYAIPMTASLSCGKVLDINGLFYVLFLKCVRNKWQSKCVFVFV